MSSSAVLDGASSALAGSLRTVAAAVARLNAGPAGTSAASTKCGAPPPQMNDGSIHHVMYL
eukprot:1514584-Prymnesium_polylepis.1